MSEYDMGKLFYQECQNYIDEFGEDEDALTIDDFLMDMDMDMDEKPSNWQAESLRDSNEFWNGYDDAKLEDMNKPL